MNSGFNFGWGSAQMLFFLIPLGAIYLLCLWDEKRRKRALEQFSSVALWSRLFQGLKPEARRRRLHLWALALACVILALARPQWGGHDEKSPTLGRDVIVALDISNSMEVEDVSPSRLRRAKTFVRRLAQSQEGDRFGLVPFAGSGYLSCPLTSDLGYFDEILEASDPSTISNQGTDLGVALETARQAILRGAAAAGEGAQVEESTGTILLISDGEDQEGGAEAAAARVKDSGVRLITLGVGTTDGGPVPVKDENGNRVTFRRTRDGKPVISKFKSDDLKKIATLGGGKYFELPTSPAGDGAVLEQIVAELGEGKQTVNERTFRVQDEGYQIPLAVAVILFLVEMSMPLAATAGLAWAVLSLGGTAWAAPASAYLSNRNGIKAYQNGKPADAEKKFDEILAGKPDVQTDPLTDAIVRFNRGAAYFKQNNPKGAVQDFADAAKGAMAAHDPKLAAKSLFNLGGALTQAGRADVAARAYLGAVEKAQEAKDPELEADARKNLELLMRQPPQQKNSKDKKDKKESKDDKDQTDKKDKGEKKDEENKDADRKDQKDGEKNSGEQPGDEKPDGEKKQDEQGKQQFQENQKQKYESAQLSKEDADRVMAEISARERELNKRLKRQNGRPSKKENDW